MPEQKFLPYNEYPNIPTNPSQSTQDASKITGIVPDTSISSNIPRYTNGKLTVANAINNTEATNLGQVLNLLTTGAEIWTAKEFDVNKLVVYNGRSWVSNASTTATDVPGTSTKWVDALSAYLNRSDWNSYNFFNYFPNSNVGLKQAKLAGLSIADNLPAVVYQTGTPTASIQENFEGFPSTIKCSLKVGDRINFLSSRLNINNIPATTSSKITTGVYLKVPDSYTGTVSLYLVNSTNGTNINNLADNEFIVLGNGWRYYRTKVSVSVAPSDGLFHIGLYLSNVAGTVATDIYIASPAILKSDIPPQPGIYNGIETYKDTLLVYTDLYDLNNNLFYDSLFTKQTLSATTFSGQYWKVSSAGTNTFTPNFRIISSDNPVGTRVLEVDISRRSSDNYISDLQPYQVFNIPANLVGKASVFSFGVWMKRPNATCVIFGIVNKWSGENATGTIVSTSNNSLITGETLGSWVFVRFNNLTIDSTTKSIEVKARVRFDPAISTPVDTVYKVQLTGFVCNIMTPSVLGWTRNSDEKIIDISGINPSSKLSGKKWCSFGDSITAAGAYQTYLINRYGLTHYLRGIGGSGVSTGTQTAWVDASGLYISRPPASPPAGTEGVDYFTILSQGYQQQRVDTIPLDSQIVSILMGTNDMQTASLGTISDASGTDSFYGRYKEMINKIYTRLPSVEIVLMTPIYRSDGAYDTRIIEAVKELAKFYKLLLIDVGDKCGINLLNASINLTDTIHPTNAGYERMSRPMISDFLRIFA